MKYQTCNSCVAAMLFLWDKHFNLQLLANTNTEKQASLSDIKASFPCRDLPQITTEVIYYSETSKFPSQELNLCRDLS